ncbi:putative uncharacterized protein DDB_G0287191 [Impatiens glandulifera]|uniref:putative uncharacterized protein DDB_G0287191 n=1 Tax=Impatiens glandulifera TaxID=253017 RepID=UPI001FB0FE58|nr:putative uncharacterized protein DDB_G0287191 [Impatiens glandulifera]
MKSKLAAMVLVEAAAGRDQEYTKTMMSKGTHKELETEIKHQFIHSQSIQDHYRRLEYSTQDHQWSHGHTFPAPRYKPNPSPPPPPSPSPPPGPPPQAPPPKARSDIRIV